MTLLAVTTALTVAISELLGATPAELRDRLGLMPVSEVHLSSVGIAPEGRTSLLQYRDLIGPDGECSSGKATGLSVGAPPATIDYLDFSFANDRLVAISAAGSGKALDPARQVSVTCRDRPKRDRVEETATVALASPLILLSQLARAPQTAEWRRAAADLGKLRLGQAPPAGLDAYLRALPKSASLVSRQGQDAAVRFNLGKGVGGPQLVDVSFTDGRVTAIAKDRPNFRDCILEADDSLHCVTPYNP